MDQAHRMSTLKLNRATLAEQVAEALIERLEAEGLRPGAPLPSIAKLAEEYGVSKPIIREALKTLEGREIIEITNGKTPIVKPITSSSLRMFFERAVALHPRSLIELLEIRRGLEIQSCLLAARHATAEEIEQMQAIISAMETHLYDHAEYAELDLRLHLLIASTSRNTLMLHLIQSIRDVLKDTIKEGLRSRFTEEQILRVQALHAAIVASIARHDADGASQTMAAHFDDAIDAIYHSMITI